MTTDVNFSDYYKPKPKQQVAHTDPAKYILFGGAMGGGKSYWLVAEAIKYMVKYPNNRGAIIRKELTVAKRTIIVTFFQVCPPQIIKSYNKSTLSVTFNNGSELLFMEGNKSKDPLLDKIKGLEIGFFGIDEANEVDMEVYNILKTRLRWKLSEHPEWRRVGRLTSNPERCWLLPTFIQNNSSQEKFIQSLTTDNYDKDSEYVQTLREAFKNNPQLEKKYLQGSWEIQDTINQLISGEAITKSNQIVKGYKGDAIGVDVARYGDDRTVFIVIKDRNIVKIESYDKTALTEVSDRCIMLMREHNIRAQNVGIDGIGVGAGVIDILKKAGHNIKEIIGGSKPVEQEDTGIFKPNNLRTQMYLQLKHDMEKGKLGNLNDDKLIEELSSINYLTVGEKKIKVTDKDTIKKTLGFSPDLADALVYANWVTMEHYGGGGSFHLS